MSEAFDPRKSATAFDQASTLVIVLELSGKSWRAGASVPGVERRPLRQLKARDLDGVLKAIEQWKCEAMKAGHDVRRVTVGYEAGLDGFWIARALREHGIEVYVMHPASIAVATMIIRCERSFSIGMATGLSPLFRRWRRLPPAP